MHDLAASFGNYMLDSQEINNLSASVLDKYNAMTGQAIERRRLNSNAKNYQELYDHIDKAVSIKNLGISSSKPFVSLFHDIKPGPKAFRKRFVDSLYKYCFDLSRYEYLAVNADEVNSIAVKQMKNLHGFWECYYSKSNTFRESFETLEKGRLCVVALSIKGENTNKATVDFFQKDNWGKGLLEVRDNHMFFQLRSEKNYMPIYLAINCGSKYIQDRNSPVVHASGTCVYIGDSGAIKTTLCYMVHYDDDRIRKKYGLHDIDVNSESFRSKFDSCREFSYKDKANEISDRIIEFFRRDQLQLV